MEAVASVADAEHIAALIQQLDKAVQENKASLYAPYRWQQEFHEAGSGNVERMLMAANRVGKTQTAGAEVALHLTGEYDELSRTAVYPERLPNGAIHPSAGEPIWPDGWKGKRFNKPILAWTGSPTAETSRDIVQKELIGGLGEEIGTGWIPKHRIIGTPTMRQAAVRNVAEAVKVRHRSGGVSTLLLKTYEQGWRKFQGSAPHVVWLDEEMAPSEYMIYSECQTRILTSNGILLVTFTPLQGETELVRFFKERHAGSYLQSATWDDAPHLGEDERESLKMRYRVHEVDARTQGIPMLGEGAVFPIANADIRIDPFRVPDYFARIKGCDFGIDHPAGGVEIAWDRDQDIVYVIDCYKKAGETAAYHAAWFNKANRGLPVAWPHDGMNREKSGGNTIAGSYRAHGVNMLSKSARYPKARGEKHDKGGPQPVEPIVDQILERMMTGRFKVFSTCPQWFEEKGSYHRKDGRIVDRHDDILKATFYAVMMLRYAVAPDSTVTRVSNAPMQSIASARI